MSTIFERFSPALELAGRILIAWIFIGSGLGKLAAYAGTQAYMEAMGVPGALLPLVIAAEVLGGALVVLGLFSRYAALGLAGFTLLAGFLFHGDASDQMQQIMFLKNLAIAGGLLILVSHGAGKISLDRRFGWS